MYMDIANLTLEEVSKITAMLTSARLSAHLENTGTGTYLYAVSEKELGRISDGIMTIV